jgi:hypothetical protein
MMMTLTDKQKPPLNALRIVSTGIFAFVGVFLLPERKNRPRGKICGLAVFFNNSSFLSFPLVLIFILTI